MSSLEEIDSIVRELRQRVTRIESRICRIGDHLEIHLTNPKDGITVNKETEDVVEMSIPIMDITLSELISYLKKRRLNNRETDVYFENELVATIYASNSQTS